MWEIALVAPPAAEPVTLAEAKKHCRIDTDADDELVTRLIVEAREWAEAYTARAFVKQDRAMIRQHAPAGAFYVARPPLIAVTSIKYLDAAGALQTLDPAGYVASTSLAAAPMVAPAHGAAWPAVRAGVGAFQVYYQAGYGPAAADVPEGIRQGILERVAFNYQARGDAAVGQGAVAMVGSGAEGTLSRYRNPWIV
jgi:uncharacterized phiE125 gp8 family phage protein